MVEVSCYSLFDEDENNNQVKYSPNPEHRNDNPMKSQWTILEEEELECFRVAYKSGWKRENNAWGLHFTCNNTQFGYLGLGRDRNIKLFIAKFKNDVPHETWHGYPADYQQNSHDVPETEILRSWVKNNILGKAKMRKIIRGEPCKLSG